MKIALLTGNLSNGGAQRVISVLASKLAENGHEVNLLVFAKHEKEYPLSKKVNILYMKNSKSEYDRYSTLRRLYDVREFLISVKPEVAVGFMEAGYALYLGSMGLKIKTVASVRNHPQKILDRKGFRAFLERRWFKAADAVVLQTERQKQYVANWGWKKCVVIPNPIPVDIIEKGKNSIVQKKRNSIMMAGRLEKQKNYPMAIEAFRLLQEVSESFSVDIYGEGKEENQIQKMIVERGLSENVFLRGWTSNVAEEMQKHSIYVLSSDYEGMPNSLMEAMGLGMICIATDCFSGPSEMITDGENGYLVPVGNSQDLADRLRSIIASDEGKNISDNAKLSINNKYNEDCIVSKWEKLFVTLIEGKEGKII